jgi:hypothetical protein
MNCRRTEKYIIFYHIKVIIQVCKIFVLPTYRQEIGIGNTQVQINFAFDKRFFMTKFMEC